MKVRIYWIRWKLMSCVLTGYIKIHRVLRNVERRWSERKGSKTTWQDVSKAMWKRKAREDRYFRKLDHLDRISDEYWYEYMDLKYK